MSNLKQLTEAVIELHKRVSLLERSPRVGAPRLPAQGMTPKECLELVAGYFDISMSDLCGKCRQVEFSWPRQLAQYLLVKQFGFRAIQASRFMGLHYTTGHHAQQAVESYMAVDKHRRQQVKELTAQITLNRKENTKNNGRRLPTQPRRRSPV